MDEWHEFLGTKRGVQLELAVSRMRTLSPRLRIWGLSATLPDLQGAMRALLGPTLARRQLILRAGRSSTMMIDSIIPESHRAFSVARPFGPRIAAASSQNCSNEGRSTLVFTNTRSQAELWYQAIVSARLDWLTTTAIHHGSIDAKIRRRVEEALKEGSLRCVICTSSLDLGVDFHRSSRCFR